MTYRKSHIWIKYIFLHDRIIELCHPVVGCCGSRQHKVVDKMAEFTASFTDPKQELLRLVKQEGNDACADCGKKGEYG